MSDRRPFDPLPFVMWLLAAMVATISAIALIGAVNCVLNRQDCSMPVIGDVFGQLIAALMGVYAGSRGGRS